MAFSEIELKRIDNLVGDLCRRKSPAHIRDQLRFDYDISQHNVHIWEVRPAYNDPNVETRHGVAKFQYIRTKRIWKLYWMRADLKWHGYNPDPDRVLTTLDEQVAEVEHDPYATFFG